MAAGGLQDIFIAYPILSRHKADALLALKDQATLSVSVDSAEAAAVLASSSSAHNHDLPIPGRNRCRLRALWRSDREGRA